MKPRDAVKSFWDWIDNRGVVRRLTLFTTLGLTIHAYWWAIHLANNSDKSGTELGLIIAAVTLPISYLQKSVFDSYLASRSKTSEVVGSAPAFQNRPGE